MNQLEKYNVRLTLAVGVVYLWDLSQASMPSENITQVHRTSLLSHPYSKTIPMNFNKLTGLAAALNRPIQQQQYQYSPIFNTIADYKYSTSVTPNRLV